MKANELKTGDLFLIESDKTVFRADGKTMYGSIRAYDASGYYPCVRYFNDSREVKKLKIHNHENN